MTHYDDKRFFKDMKKEVQDYSDNIRESFPYFCLKIFWDYLLKDDIEEALHGLGINDESIDAFFVDEPNEEINIIQCRACDSEKDIKALKKESLSFLDDVPSKLENHEFIDSHHNIRIKEIAEEYIKFKNKGFKIKLHFFHLGRASKNSLMHFENRIQYHDWSRIKDEYQEYLSKLDRTEPPSIEIQLGYPSITPSIGKQHRTFVSIITGDEIINLREQYRYKLFDKNLRFGLGKNKINKGIMNSAIGEPDNFYFFNNGITITSKGFKLSQTNDRLRIEYPQIINGAQTVNAIYEAFNKIKNKIARESQNLDADIKAKETMKRIRLLFRVIQDEEKDGKKTSAFEEKVIRFNNTQNSIKETDFYANNPEQIQLQEMLAKHGYFYETKRGDRKFLEERNSEHNLLKMTRRNFKHWEEKMNIEKLASIWMAYQEDPALDKLQISNLFGYVGDIYYNSIFGKADDLTEYKVKEMILAWNLFNLISEQSDIYGRSKKKGQIINKVSQFSKSSSDKFSDISKIIKDSFVFGTIMQDYFISQEKFLEGKEPVVEEIKKYYFFSMGRYLTLAIFNLILNTCKYKSSLIEDTNLFQNKLFLKTYLVKPWLRIILKELLSEEYANFNTNSGYSLRTFYRKASTWDNIQSKFKGLEIKKDMKYQAIFELNLDAKSR